MPEGACRRLHVSQLGLGFRALGVDEDGNRGRRGHQLSRKRQSLARHLGCQQVQARGIATRAVEAGQKAVLHRIEAADEENGNRRGGLLGCLGDGQRRGSEDRAVL